MKKISQNLSKALVQNNIRASDLEKQCQYGLELMLSSIIEILFIIALSPFFGNFVQTLIFFIGFIPLRIYSGGYHADTQLRCFAILVEYIYFLLYYFVFYLLSHINISFMELPYLQ